ncbi:MAG TPA: hypothetical protein VK186_27140 [Candidatus Deferrimicrobium sp.]|nr:hypothetical protein [Candidatus Kapabacteria bacterium]HLP62544.1 hypothetical protein [Candidatus Deferrimicrobium sp.]
MKKLLRVLAILLVVGVLVTILIPTGNIHGAQDPGSGTDLRDPHFHNGTWTTCCNTLTTACASN